MRSIAQALGQGACVVAAVVLSGCATHRAASSQATAPLEKFVEQVRKLSMEARPSNPRAATLEQRYPELAAAQLLVSVSPTAEHHRAAAEAYADHDILDIAYDHYRAALDIQPRDAASLDGLARIWRDWGYPHLGLTYAYRAIYYEPGSAGPRNTLGTLLLRMGHLTEAAATFERTLALEPHASYVLSNLCYTDVLLGRIGRAINRCQAAIDAEPTLSAAHNNLALAYAKNGDLAAAAREFSLGGSLAAARYNMGVALMASARYRDAADAFDEAAALNPSLAIARGRAKQARRLAESNPETPTAPELR